MSEQDRLALLLRSGNLLQVLLEFFLGGLLLAFTPCVLPMVPILSGLIVGTGHRVTTMRAFVLSLTYVLGMAVTYTATGVACAAAGKQVQAIFQQPWIIMLFAALFVAMAFSMFGLFTVQMPSFVQSRLAQISNRQRSGSFLGVGVMGMLSALIVTTCVGPVLVAALIVIGQTGDMFRGGAALFAMSLGMGAPLLVVGSSAGRWLPRAGAWMDGVKRLFGVLMLAMAAWMLSRIVPARATLLLFAVPALAAAVVCWDFAGWRARTGLWLTRGGAVLAALYAVALLIGAARGAEDPLQPLAAAGAGGDALEFHPVASVADLRAQVQAAAAAHQAVLLDIDADWCTSCKEMQRYTFTDPQVRRALQSVRLLRANVTANSSEDQALLHEFRIFGPPTIALYDASGHEQQALPRGRLHESRAVRRAAAPGVCDRLSQPMQLGRAALTLALVGLCGLAAGYLSYRLLRPRPAPQPALALAPAPDTQAPEAPAGQPAARPIPTDVPDMNLPDPEGRHHALHEYFGHPLIVNFWATWCPPCRREIPLLGQLRTQYRKDGLEIVGVAVDFAPSVRAFLHATPVPYPVLIAEQDGLSSIGQFGMEPVLPFSVFADSRGRILAVKVGELHREEARAILTAALAIDAGRLELASAREQLRARLATLAAERAKAQQSSP